MKEPPLDEELIDSVCQSFKCLPSQAKRELRRDPELVFDILALREYRIVKQQVDNAKTEADVPKGEMADLVIDLMLEAMQERAEE